MAYTQNKAVELAKSFLKQASKRYPIRLAYLFGSYVRGTQKDYSDIDVALVMSGKGERYYEESLAIFHEAQEYNSMLEVICFREDEFEQGEAAVAAQIKREGLQIDFA